MHSVARHPQLYLRHPRVARHLFRPKFRCDTSGEWGGGERCDTKIFRGGGATLLRQCAATPAKRYKIQEISCDTCSETSVARQGVPRSRVQLRPEGCGGLRGESPGAFPKAGRFSSSRFPCQKLAEIAFCAAGKFGEGFSSSVEILLENFSSKENQTATAE